MPAEKSGVSKCAAALAEEHVRPHERFRSGTSLGLAGNVDFECRRDAVDQLRRYVVLPHNFDRLRKFDASLIDLKTLSGKRLGNVTGGNGAE